MDLTRENMDSVFTGYNTVLNQGLSQANKEWEKFATPVPSSAAIEQYPFKNLPSGMKKWIGDREIARAEGKMLQVVNADYANAIAVSRNDIMWDRMGIHNSLFLDMGLDAGNLWARLAIMALATNPKWADGKKFFLTDRKFGKNTVINNILTDALSAEAFSTAFARMMGFQDSVGDGLGLVPDTLMVGPTLRKTGKKIVEAEIISEVVGENAVAVSNRNKGDCDLVVNPYLVGDYAGLWFVMNTKRGVKPVVVQKAKEGTLTRMDREDSECVFKNNENEYGIHSIGASAPTYPQLVIGGGFSE